MLEPEGISICLDFYVSKTCLWTLGDSYTMLVFLISFMKTLKNVCYQKYIVREESVELQLGLLKVMTHKQLKFNATYISFSFGLVL